MEQRKQAGANDREQGHGFGKPVNRGPPFLKEEKQDGGDERAGMSNADPPNEVRDGKAPGDRDVNSPNPRAAIKQVANCHAKDQEQREGGRKSDEPEFLMRVLEGNAA